VLYGGVSFSAADLRRWTDLSSVEDQAQHSPTRGREQGEYQSGGRGAL